MNRYKSSTKIKPQSSANIIFEEEFQDGYQEPQQNNNPRFKSIPSKATLVLEEEILQEQAKRSKLKERPVEQLKMTSVSSAEKIKMNNFLGSKNIQQRKPEPTSDQLNPEKGKPNQAVQEEDPNQKLTKLVQKQIQDRQKWQKMAEQKQKSIQQNSSHTLHEPSQNSENPLVVIQNGEAVKKSPSKKKLQKIATHKYEANNITRNDLLKSNKGQEQDYVTPQVQTKNENKQESPQKKKRSISELRPLKKKLSTHEVLNQLDMIKKKQSQHTDADSPHKKSMLKRRILAKDIQDMEHFNNEELASGMYIEGTLERNRTGICNLMFPQYRIVFDDENIIYAKKTMKGYDIMLDPSHPDFLQTKKLATVKGNFVGSYFNIYEGEEEKEILATVYYNPDSKAVTREVELYMKRTDIKYWDCDRDNDHDTAFYSLKSLYLQGDNRCEGKIRKYISKQPFYDQKTKSYKLDFGGKATVLSVKNVILVEAQNPRYKVFVFGKCGDNKFNLKAEHPLSPVVVMGYLMTSFNFKFATQ